MNMFRKLKLKENDKPVVNQSLRHTIFDYVPVKINMNRAFKYTIDKQHILPFHTNTDVQTIIFHSIATLKY